MSKVPDSSELAPDLAKRLLLEGGTFVLLDMPVGSEFGIDMESWNTGEKFKGIKMIPPGLHFIYYSSTNAQGDRGLRTGFFHVFGAGELLVKKWDALLEDISEEAVDVETCERIKLNLRDLDGSLGPYPYSLWKKWVSLTNKITDSVLERVEPSCGKIVSALQLIPGEFTMSKNQEGSGSSGSQDLPPSTTRLTAAEREDAMLPKMMPVSGTEFKFTKFPSKSYPTNSTPQDITRHNMDMTFVLESVTKAMSKPVEILGELQFAFICFLVAENFDAFEHWKHLVRTICLSDRALVKHPTLFSSFISDLHFQLQEASQDLFVDIVSSNNFLFNCLQRFFENISDNEQVDASLRSKADRFKSYLTRKFEWDFEEESEEFLPVIVSVA